MHACVCVCLSVCVCVKHLTTAVFFDKMTTVTNVQCEIRLNYQITKYLILLINKLIFFSFDS